MPISRSRCSFQLGKNLLAKNNAVGWFLLVVWGWGGVTHHREIDQSIFHAFKEEEKKSYLLNFYFLLPRSKHHTSPHQDAIYILSQSLVQINVLHY